jgi:regulator of sigma D
MLALYSKLIGFKPFGEVDNDTCDILEEFCETLVDYTLQAHLNVYRFLDEKLEKRQSVLQLAEQIYPRILKTTEVISNFNDTYEVINDKLDSSHLEEHLSTLGENLAERIELEDQLISVLCRPVEQKQASPANA